MKKIRKKSGKMISVDNSLKDTTVPVVGVFSGPFESREDKSSFEQKVEEEISQLSLGDLDKSDPKEPDTEGVEKSLDSSKKNKWRKTKRTFPKSSEEKVSIYDVTKNWIDSENDTKLWNAKKLLFKFSTTELRNRDFMFCAPIYDFIDYLSDGSRGYFTLVADHVDYTSEKIARLYDWRVRDNRNNRVYHVYIVAIGKAPTSKESWAERRLRVYHSVVEKNWDSEKNTITPKGYSIVRRFATTDLCTSFMELKFFTNFNIARTFITSSVGGFVHFIKKTKPSVEEDNWEVGGAEWDDRK